MRKIKLLIFLIIGIIGGLIFTQPVFAQKVGVSISPLTFELNANPGDDISNKLKIYNPTDSVITIKMEVEDFKTVGETGQVIVTPEEETTYSLKKWVNINPIEFTLEPGESEFVNFDILVPENAEPGGKYGSILASPVAIMGDEPTGASVSSKVGALLLLTIAGEVKEGLIIKEFFVPSFLETGPVPFTIRLENTGTVHLRPRGFVTISDWRDKKVTDIPFPQNNIIPGSIRKIEASWDSKWLFGKYTAILVGSYGISNIPFTATMTFWAFPWKMASGIFSILLLLAFYFYKSRKRWRLALKILIKGER
ncbi:MAG: DUF916 domain-containing protein [Patescibacteria group bacterium]|nr:DUF916 domain-containing protein [Patescibacteria group bacterium]MBU1877152.1 DUF916 domain-containing protein [Patescibacteria group bacterium]